MSSEDDVRVSSVEAGTAEPTGGGGVASGTSEEGPRTFKFPSHQSHMVSLAKMCKEKADYTDCVIQCATVSTQEEEEEEENTGDKGDDPSSNKLRAHRLVLGAASPFLKAVFSDIPQSLPEATILVPGVKKRVVSALLDFLYSGEMKVEREDTAELQLLIETLQIDPSLISVQCLDDDDDSSCSDSEEEDAGNHSEHEESEKSSEKGATLPSSEDSQVVPAESNEQAKKRKAEDGPSDNGAGESASAKVAKSSNEDQ